ncbi:putative secreted protein with C-terminal beta-propeller domain [Clostridium beijerinckii]|uniref:hypothetical protein n=1 Tax=Clostridium beijerinckii TaxID=1520 RepID=UPI0020C5E7D7|nr:hypothetical protein [Clostridium beijerinckii]NRZ87536.1 putative secreted protein with C-terminal beta-propeller domain [Clostridium beijerinckii]
MSKKVIAVILSVGILTSVFTGCAQKQQEPTSGNKNVTSSVNKEVYSRAESVDSGDAKKLLIEGNKRFVSGNVLGEDISKENLKKTKRWTKAICSNSFL